MPLISYHIAHEGFNHLEIKTSARAKLQKASRAYLKAETLQSAQLFLESWRILRGEYEEGLFKEFDSCLLAFQRDLQEKAVVRANNEMMLLGLLALHDLAMACFCTPGEYKDDSGKCKLDTYALQFGWKGSTTTEVLEIEDENGKIKPPFPKGSGIAHVLPLNDPLGRLLDKVTTFREAAYVISSTCSVQLNSGYEPLKEYRQGLRFIEFNLQELRDNIGSGRIGTQAAKDQAQERANTNSEDDDDEETREKLVLKMKDMEAEKIPINKEDEKELSRVFERFHVTNRASLWKYKGKSFEQIQEEKNDSDTEDEEEKRPLLKSG